MKETVKFVQDYRIIHGYTPEQLEAALASYLERGWYCTGGPVMTYLPNTKWFQAIVRMNKI